MNCLCGIAKFPVTLSFSTTFLDTTLPIFILALSPIIISFRTVLPNPIHTLFPITVLSPIPDCTIILKISCAHYSESEKYIFYLPERNIEFLDDWRIYWFFIDYPIFQGWKILLKTIANIHNYLHLRKENIY